MTVTDREPATERAADVHGSDADADRPLAQPPRRPPSLAERGPEFEPTLQMRTIDDLGLDLAPPPAPIANRPLVASRRPPSAVEAFDAGTFDVGTSDGRGASRPGPTVGPGDDDPLGLGSSIPLHQREYLRRLEAAHLDERIIPWRTIGLSVLAVAVLIVGFLVVNRIRSGGDGSDVATVNRNVAQMQATVLIEGLDPAGKVLCLGSGTVVSTDGLILTNAHVVTRDATCNFTRVGVAVTDNDDAPPQLRYEAGLVAIDPLLDLAVLKVTAPIDPSQALPTTFAAITLGDSDALDIGDPLGVWGYPEIGGETITLTNGTVSGFTAQAGIGERALIKTDAAIAGGNSGGAAVDAAGNLVGIPTKARASENGPAVDCRFLADTNKDGSIDNNDTCIPIGGFLNGIRPINLAKPLVEQARTAVPQPFGEASLSVEVDPGTIVMTQPRFSLDTQDDAPKDVVRTAVAGSPKLCLFVDWAGVPDGAVWDAIWFVDGTPVSQYSMVGRNWTFGPEGANFWVCAIDKKQGLPAGLYELGFFVGGQLVFAEGIQVTEKPATVHSTTWRNQTGAELCSLAINPRGSGPVGLNELLPGGKIKADGSATIDLPDGDYLVEARDCEGTPVADSGNGGAITVDADHTAFTISKPKQQ